MKRSAMLFSLFLMMSLMLFAAGPKTYQVTGPILDVKGDVITVQKRHGEMGNCDRQEYKKTGRPQGGVQSDD